MSELREKMKMDMELRGYSPKTIKNYINHISSFAKFYNKSPDLLEENEIVKKMLEVFLIKLN